MLPSRGLCHAIFVLARAAQLRTSTSVEEWLKVARRQATFAASASNLDRVAELLIRNELVHIGDKVEVTRPLNALTEKADRATFVEIARLLLEKNPPVWLDHALIDGGIATEYIPTQDLTALQWLEEDLLRLLSDVAKKFVLRHENHIRKRLGDAGELVVLAVETTQGNQPRHVSRISDSYGYDIEVPPPKAARLEVKSAVTHTADSFFISRNEFEKSQQFADTWCIVQVVFCPTVLVKEHLGAADVKQIRRLSAASLALLIPLDTNSFSWSEAAKITPPAAMWSLYDLELDSRLEIHIPLTVDDRHV